MELSELELSDILRAAADKAAQQEELRRNQTQIIENLTAENNLIKTKLHDFAYCLKNAASILEDIGNV